VEPLWTFEIPACINVALDDKNMKTVRLQWTGLVSEQDEVAVKVWKKSPTCASLAATYCLPGCLEWLRDVPERHSYKIALPLTEKEDNLQIDVEGVANLDKCMYCIVPVTHQRTDVHEERHLMQKIVFFNKHFRLGSVPLNVKVLCLKSRQELKHVVRHTILEIMDDCKDDKIMVWLEFADFNPTTGKPHDCTRLQLVKFDANAQDFSALDMLSDVHSRNKNALDVFCQVTLRPGPAVDVGLLCAIGLLTQCDSLASLDKYFVVGEPLVVDLTK
jgi:hypothetical protein